MALHADMGIEVVERTVRLRTVRPRTSVQTLDLVVSSARPLTHGIAGQRHERVRLRHRRRRLFWVAGRMRVVTKRLNLCIAAIGNISTPLDARG